MFRISALLVLIGFYGLLNFSPILLYSPVRAEESAIPEGPTPQPPPKLDAQPQPEPTAPPEPSSDAPPPHLGVGTCWFAPAPEDAGFKCRATFTLCPAGTSDTCSQWIWVSCRNKYIFIGAHTPNFGGPNLAVIGLPFGPYSIVPVLVLYGTEGQRSTGTFALLSYRQRNRYGACLLIAGSQARGLPKTFFTPRP